MDGDTVTVFDTARSRATFVEVIRGALEEHPTGHNYDDRAWCDADDCDWAVTTGERGAPGVAARHTAEKIAEALLAARSSTTCETCHGGEEVPNTGSHERYGAQRPCPECHGSGTVPGGPLLLDLVAEQLYVEWFEGPAGATAAVIQPRSVPVYVAREST